MIARACIAASAVVATSVVLSLVGAAPPKGPPPPDAAGPPTSIQKIGRIARVRIDVSPGGAAVVHDVVFPKDALTVLGPGEPTLFVAFTAQARPLAIEATKHALDTNDALVEVDAKKLDVIDVAVRPKTSALLLGPPVQAGHVIRLPRDASPFGLRLRSAIATNEVVAPTRMVSILARLGVRGATPLLVERIEIGAMLGATIRGARATFCGDAADERPLTVVFPQYPSSSVDAGTISPSSAKRTPTDDLCVDVLL